MLLWMQFFFSPGVLSARARARAHGPPRKRGGALGALPIDKSNFKPFRARGEVRAGCEILRLSRFIKVQILGFRCHIIRQFDEILRTFDLHHFRKASYGLRWDK